VLYVLAGVNGGGKSSLGGRVLREAGMDWFNPDDWSRALQAAGRPRELADADAWAEGQRRLHEAIANGDSFAFETTLGGRTVTATLIDAARSHDVLVWYVGLDSVERHLERIALRVRHGGHDIPAAKVRERWLGSMANLTRLVPHAAGIQVFDNSTPVPEGEPLRPPTRVAAIESGRLRWPLTDGLQHVPRWAVPVVEAALR
jgi:predicted ABC-type ATPase